MPATLQTMRAGGTQHPEEIVNFLASRIVSTSGVFKKSSGGFLVDQETVPAMSVKVAMGYAFLVKSDGSMVYPVRLSGAAASAVIGANSSGNSRIDAVVLYIDLSASANSDISNVAKLAVVAGTPAGSPTAPSDATIQAAIGASNPFIRLSNVTVASGAVSIVTANCSDQRVECRFDMMVSEDTTFQTYNTGMRRQAVINGNFDIWQRATSTTNPANSAFVADRWKVLLQNTGTLPTTIIHSRQNVTLGELLEASSHYRINPNGAGSGFGASDDYGLLHLIEFGTRFLAGLNKKVTVSFYAKSSIANKKLGVAMVQRYGTGGSPSSPETINGEAVTLTSSWQKFSHTFDLNTLVGKTLGSANDDYLELRLSVMWGATQAALYGATAAETFVGSGNIDIAQVQICAGDADLPFCPKSYDEELRACQRFCFVPDTSDGNVRIGAGGAISTTIGRSTIHLPVKLRKLPTLTATASQFVYEAAGGTSPAGSSIVIGSTQNSTLSPSIDLTTSGLTAGQCGALRSAGANLFILDAEL